jgi:hypothetical protein
MTQDTRADRHQQRRVKVTKAVYVVVAAAIVLLGACEARKAIRSVTYSPDFRYLEEGDVTSAMWILARDVRALKGLLGGANGLTPEAHEEVVRLLREMESTAAQLDPAGRRSNHPRIDRNIDAFRRDLSMARQAAERDPPNYFLAGNVAGSCSYCHEGQREDAR